MSNGSQIGGVIGGVIGFVASGYNPVGAQWGYAIGSGIGAYVDPTVVKGPQITDSVQQTSSVGAPIPYGWGRFPCTGNVIWAGPLVSHKKRERVGKGGQINETYTYTRSYAIGVCEGPINDYVWIKKNGKYVYAADPDWLGNYLGWDAKTIADLKAARTKFLSYATLYKGTDTQMPDSTIEAVVGVGNVSPFRDLAYIVIENEDQTDQRGALSQWEFCVDKSIPTSYLTTVPPTPLWEPLIDIPAGGTVRCVENICCYFGNLLFIAPYGADHLVAVDPVSGASSIWPVPYTGGTVQVRAVASDGGKLLVIHTVSGDSTHFHATAVDGANQQISTTSIPFGGFGSAINYACGFMGGYWTIAYMDGLNIYTTSSDDVTSWPAVTSRFGVRNVLYPLMNRCANGWLFCTSYVSGASENESQIHLLSADGSNFTKVLGIATSGTFNPPFVRGDGDWLIASIQVASGSSNVHSYESTDGGHNWAKISETAFPGAVLKGSRWFTARGSSGGKWEPGRHTDDGVTFVDNPFYGEAATNNVFRPVRMGVNGYAFDLPAINKIMRTTKAWSELA